ncbi:hypothetical protein C8A01DRAFT_13788 [Parachaetomium inaequale]|uniref:DNA/RNA-binding protein Alba-like domain-containing protein n=1 Tax=Parachaetomium inaequale TaxID=2588326 RepID=A0AAN6PM83_9PEZI|nr:hypothetical protein C8A01DRAFT_13788 [Parachaetomium inaequale]
MAAQSPMQLSPPNPSAGKRKFHSDSNDPTTPRKRRAADLQTETRTQNRPQNPPPTPGGYSQVYNPLLARLSHKVEVKAMSVMPSTSISRHVDRALEHLGRFSPWDQAILPGVVVLCAKSAATSKLITIAELVRRRIGESEQKWFQYNVPKEMVLQEAAPAATEEPSVVEDTFMAVDQGGDGGADDDDEYFEPRQPTIHEQAVQPAKVRYKAHMAVVLSRVPLDELQSEPNVSVQTNEERIEYLRKKRMGLAG